MDKRLILSCDTEIDSSLSKCEQEFIDQFIAKYLNSTEAEIKTAVYLTDPMKYVLRQEKDGRNKKMREKVEAREMKTEVC